MENKTKIGVVGVGIVGLGNMGSAHCRSVETIEKAQLSAVCDLNEERARACGEQYACPSFTSLDAMLDQSEIDGLIIATPHYSHPEIAIAAMKRGIHVLCEKPIGVHPAHIQPMLDSYEAAKKSKPDLIFSAMFQMRFRKDFQKMKEIISSGSLGKLMRLSWIVTDWFRSQHYYNSGGWRATWAGEGGGVLLNQCPHNLDLLQWLVGMPSSVQAQVRYGKYHDIEVEDEVNAMLAYDSGLSAQFVTSTAEAPGTNRLEVVGEKGKLILENGELLWVKNTESCLDFIKSSERGFAKPEVHEEKIDIDEASKQDSLHRDLIENFCLAILKEEPSKVDAREGIHSVHLANAMLMSSDLDKRLSLPLDAKAYEAMLQEKIDKSRFVKKTVEKETIEDLSKSFS